MKYIYKVLTLISVATLLSACRTEHTAEQAEMMVTIAPLKYIVEQITADDFRVGVLVPAGTSPETFDPTPRQIVDINNAKLLFSTGLIEFEQNILSRLDNQSKVISLSRGIELIEGSHSHGDHAEDGQSRQFLSRAVPLSKRRVRGNGILFRRRSVL